MSSSVRVLLASDVHVGEWAADRGTAVTLLVDAAIAYGADLLVLVGDTFDHNRVPTEVGQALTDELGRLDIPVVVLPGNHDCLVPGAIWSRVVLPENVHVLTDPDGQHLELHGLDLELWGRPHPSYSDLRPLAGLPPRGQRTWQVALAHGHMVLGPDDLHRAYQITPEEISNSDRDYVALGHWDVARDMSAGGVTARYSGSASRFNVCALATLTLDGDGTRQVDVESLRLAGSTPEPPS
ncbi:MAG: metallophosphoesterase [Ilumatobacteraceae bacterium]